MMFFPSELADGELEQLMLADGELEQLMQRGLVAGKQIQYDNSGVGHNYRNIHADDIPENHREVLEGEIMDGKRESGEEVVGGQHYRW